MASTRRATGVSYLSQSTRLCTSKELSIDRYRARQYTKRAERSALAFEGHSWVTTSIDEVKWSTGQQSRETHLETIGRAHYTLTRSNKQHTSRCDDKLVFWKSLPGPAALRWRVKSARSRSLPLGRARSARHALDHSLDCQQSSQQVVVSLNCELNPFVTKSLYQQKFHSPISIVFFFPFSSFLFFM